MSLKKAISAFVAASVMLTSSVTFAKKVYAASFSVVNNINNVSDESDPVHLSFENLDDNNLDIKRNYTQDDPANFDSDNSDLTGYDPVGTDDKSPYLIGDGPANTNDNSSDLTGDDPAGTDDKSPDLTEDDPANADGDSSDLTGDDLAGTDDNSSDLTEDDPANTDDNSFDLIEDDPADTDDNGSDLTEDDPTDADGDSSEPSYDDPSDNDLSTPEEIEFRFTTESSFEEAVRYVPFSFFLKTNYSDRDDKTVTYELSNNDLPNGITLNKTTGEIYGAPLDYGYSYFSITASCGEEKIVKQFSIRVNDNYNKYVANETDADYEILTYVGKQYDVTPILLTAHSAAEEAIINPATYRLTVNEQNSDQEFKSKGEFKEFVKLWLNGKVLARDTDYTAEEGSTKITIMSQTLQSLPEDSLNTIAAEFRIGRDNVDRSLWEMRTSTQNLYIGLKGTKNVPLEENNTKRPTPTPIYVDMSETSDEQPDTSDEQSESETDVSSVTQSSITESEQDSKPTNAVSEADTNADFETPPVSPDSPIQSSDTDKPNVESKKLTFVPRVPAETDKYMAAIIGSIKVQADEGVLPDGTELTVKPDMNVVTANGIALDFTFFFNGSEIQPDGSVVVVVSIPDNYIDKNLYVYHIEEGKYVLIESSVSGNKIAFIASHFSTYVISDKRLDENGNEIIDKSAESYENVETPGASSDGNPDTGVTTSAIWMLISGAALIIILKSAKRNN